MMAGELTIDLNCDLAEGEPPALTAALMACTSSVNVACAGHAGSVESMQHAIALGKSLGRRLGAHPGLPSHFGRAPTDGLTPEALVALLHEQVGRFRALAAAAGAPMHHVKLHGALYHATELSPPLRLAFINFMRTHAPAAVVFALAHGKTVADARAAGQPAWNEAFADRAYHPDGSLVPRPHPDAVLTDPAVVADRVARLARGRPITAIDGSPLSLHPQTLCIHSDSPNSLALLQAAHLTLNTETGTQRTSRTEGT